MKKTLVPAVLCALGALIAFWFLLQTPGSLTDALSRPFKALRGTQIQLNSTLIEASVNSEPVRAASRRLLKPWGAVQLVRIYEAPETDGVKKRR